MSLQLILKDGSNKNNHELACKTLDIDDTLKIDVLEENTPANGILCSSTLKVDRIEEATPTNGVFMFNGVKMPNNGVILNYYDTERPFNTALANVWAAPQNFNVNLERVGNIVVLSYPELSATAVAATFATSTVALPDDYRPSVDQNFVISVRNNSAYDQGVLVIKTDGIIELYKGLRSVFAGSGLAGTYAGSVSYTI